MPVYREKHTSVVGTNSSGSKIGADPQRAEKGFIVMLCDLAKLEQGRYITEEFYFEVSPANYETSKLAFLLGNLFGQSDPYELLRYSEKFKSI